MSIFYVDLLVRFVVRPFAAGLCVYDRSTGKWDTEVFYPEGKAKRDSVMPIAQQRQSALILAQLERVGAEENDETTQWEWFYAMQSQFDSLTNDVIAEEYVVQA